MRRTSIAAVALAVVTPLSIAGAQDRAARSSDTSFIVVANAVIDITVRRGDLVVRGTDRSTAELRTNGRDYQLRSSGVSVTLAVASNNTSRGRSSGNTNDSPDIELLVPRNVRLVVRGTSGDVHVSDVSGDVEVHVISGDIFTKTLGGRAILDAVSGDVSVADGVGDLRVTTIGGDIVASQVRGTVEIGTTSGEVSLSSASFSQVQVTTVSGTVILDGAISSDARMQFTSHSGDVVLRLPESASGVLEVSTFSGSVSGGPLTLVPSVVRSLTGRRSDLSLRQYEFGGGGGSRISISTFSGDVTLQRGTRRTRDQ